MTYRLLVPLDGSEVANQAIRWADELAGALHADVELLRVLSLDLGQETAEVDAELNRKLASLTASEAVKEFHHRVIENERADAESTLSQARRRFHRVSSVETVVDHGSAEDVIVARAQMTDSTLIAMATHGRSGVARALLGSVTAGVIRRSGVPVLAVRPRLLMPPHAPQRVLVPLDTSDLAASVIPYVVQLARELDWSLILCSVVDLPPPSLSVQGAAIPLGRVPDRPPAEIMDYLDQTAAAMRAQGLDVAINAGTGDRATAIVEAAQKTHSGLIAMSTHGRHGMGRLAFGSVAEAVIRHADVPVLAVHPRQVGIGARAAMSPAEATAT